MKRAVSRLRVEYVKTLVYMLQAVEYEVLDYVRWVRRTKDFRYRRVARRGKIVWTRKAKMLAVVAAVSWALVFVLLLVVANLVHDLVVGEAGLVWLDFVLRAVVAVKAMVVSSAVTAYVILVPLLVGKWVVQKPIERRRVRAAREKLAGISAVKIAVAGSYGKTTMKDVLVAVLGGGRRVAAPVGNVNQPLGLARFVDGLVGDEEVLVMEMGEYRRGDIGEMCEWVRPDLGIITGVNEAHLEKFGSVCEAAATIFGLRDFVGWAYVSEGCGELAGEDDVVFGEFGVGGWKVSGVVVEASGTRFVMKKGRRKLEVCTELLGRHLVGAVAVAVALAAEMGMSDAEILAGLAEVRAHEHRMKAREVNGAIVIDDTYNGNIDGVRAGIGLLSELAGGRKIYVTPGLVEQGEMAREIHEEIGELLAAAGIDEVVLMRNSVSGFIEAGLVRGGFLGEVLVVDDPAEYYGSMGEFLAAGMVVLMQNDWGDRYF